jgi:hypothetical protein
MSLFDIDLELEQDERKAVKTAVILATSRYRDTIGKFVQGKAGRFDIVKDQVWRLAYECAEASGANGDEVAVQFWNQITSEVAVSEPEKQKVDQASEYNNSDEVPPSGDKAHPSEMSDVKDTEAVLADEPTENLDMNTDTDLKSHDFISNTKEATQTPCPYCGHMMMPVQNPMNPQDQSQQRCPNCGASIQASPGQQQQQPMPGGILPPGGESGGLYTQQRPYSKCARCEDTDAEEGSILCEACNHFVVTGETKTADPQDPDLPTDENVQSPSEEDPTEQQLPPAVKEDTNGPAEVYTGVVQQTANQNAAMAWSTPGDDDIQQIAQQYGIQPDEVRKNLRIVADFGDALAVNGDPNGDPNMDNFTELQGFGGRIPTTEEGVDVDSAVQHTADRTNLSPDDVYALVKESYGSDLGGQHYVSVTGEAHYYLPANLVPQQTQQQPQQDTDSPDETQQQAMQSHLTSLTSFLEWEKAQLARDNA